MTDHDATMARAASILAHSTLKSSKGTTESLNPVALSPLSTLKSSKGTTERGISYVKVSSTTD
jgi:hypothetical protein